MLKITVSRQSDEKTLILEGKLIGAWVSEVDSSWKAESSEGQAVRVDLAGVTFIDADGKALLRRLHREGATLLGNGCLTKAIIAEVSGRLGSTTTEDKSSSRAQRAIKPAVISIFFFLFAGNHLAQAEEKPTISLTLHDAVVLALKQNPQVQIGVLQTAESRQDQNIARADLLPQAQLNTSISVVRANIETNFGKPLPGFAEHLGPFEVFSTGPQLNAPILDLTLWSRYQASKENASSARADLQSVREQMTLLTVSQYLGALRAAAEVHSAESRVSLAQALYDQAADLQKNGVGTGIDTLRANVELQNETQRLIVARTQHQVALFGLARLLNLDPYQAVELADEVSFFQTPEFVIAGTIESAYQARPELQQVEANLRAAAATKRAASQSRLPVVQASGNWQYQGLSINTGIPVYEYQVGMNLPLFTGGRIHAEIVRTDLEVQKLEQRRADLRDEIALEVKTALAQLDSSKHQVEVANLGVQLAQEEVTQARDRFTAGVANNIEVIQAQDALARANDNQIAALYEYNQSRADLAHAVGQMESLYTK
ncbi:MAG TPA: TolC family protein [Candidatus Acidoferrales bacterium]|nr:TolC family protein [Candidatus Acidoferrales bacterium]